MSVTFAGSSVLATQAADLATETPVRLTRDALTSGAGPTLENTVALMPAYYVTWGRYTQLTGLLLLPALIVLTGLLVERPRGRIIRTATPEAG